MAIRDWHGGQLVVAWITGGFLAFAWLLVFHGLGLYTLPFQVVNGLVLVGTPLGLLGVTWHGFWGPT